MMTERMRDRLSRSPRPPATSALITGATGGIGEAFARALPPETALVLTGRDETKLHTLAAEIGPRATTVVADIATPEGMTSIVDAAEREGVDLVINNAGLGEYGAFLDTDFERHRTTVRVNVEAAIELIHRLVPGLIRRAELSDQRAGLINMASATAFYPVPTFATYAASKAFLLSFTESLAAELSREPIDILVACPGAVRTGFGSRAGYSGGAIPGAMSADKAANATLSALGKQTTVVIGPASAAAFTPVARARSLFGQAFMSAARVMDRVGGRD